MVPLNPTIIAIVRRAVDIYSIAEIIMMLFNFSVGELQKILVVYSH